MGPKLSWLHRSVALRNVSRVKPPVHLILNRKVCARHLGDRVVCTTAWTALTIWIVRVGRACSCSEYWTLLGSVLVSNLLARGGLLAVCRDLTYQHFASNK